MLSIASLLVVVSLSLLITKVATIALSHTGLTRESAKFQARSAFTGVGFTTAEAERAVNHPVRRRIVMILMFLGNAGLITAVSSLILTFAGDESATTNARNIGLIVLGLAALWLITRSHWLDGKISNAIEWALLKYTDVDLQDYASLLKVTGDYRVLELKVDAGGKLVGHTLEEIRPRDRGVVILGIERTNGDYLGVPTGNDTFEAQDRVIAYGHHEAVERFATEMATE